MEENNTILSICIPTFNRKHYLKEMLEILLPQSKELEVEICISDNCSTDGTEEFVRKISMQYDNVNYFRNHKNIGMDLNIINSMKIAKGKYLLPIGDDEILPNGSLSTIVKIINSHKNLDVIFLDGWYTNEKLEKTKELLPPFLKGCYFYSPIETLDNLYKYQALGSFVISKGCLSSDWYKKYLGTYQAYCGVIWDYLLDQYKKTEKCLVVCCNEPVVLLRVIEKTWKSEFIKIMLYDIPKFISTLPDYYSEIKSKIIKDYCKERSKFIFLLSYRKNHALNNKMIDKYMHYFSPSQIKKAKLISILSQKSAGRILILIINIKSTAKKVLHITRIKA